MLLILNQGFVAIEKKIIANATVLWKNHAGSVRRYPYFVLTINYRDITHE